MTAPAIPRIESRPIAELHEWDRNPRKISKPRLEQLKRALAAEPEMLEARPLIALPDGTVVAGNQRLRAARELGWVSLPVCTVDLDPDRAAEWALRDNQGYGEDDEALVGKMLAELAAAGRDIDLTGYDSASVDRLLAAVRPAPVVDPDEVPALPAEPQSVRGEVYELGAHRLMCGDATSAEDVALLLDGEEVVVMVTDPPYGVELEMEWRDRAGLNGLAAAEASYMQRPRPFATGTSGSISGDTKVDWSDAFELVRSLLVAYVWHAGRFAPEVADGLRRIGFTYLDQIIWNKGFAPITRTHYWYGHEPCWYAHKPRSPWIRRYKGNVAPSTVWDAPSPKTIFSNSTETKVDHPTQKPVVLYQRPIENHLHLGEPLYDPFAGSGTGLIACEQLGRRALCMEIDPGYCDVIRQRYADFTNQPALAP